MSETQQPDNEERRLAIFWVTAEQFLMILGLLISKKADAVRPTAVNLPPDAKVRSVHYDFAHHSFAIVLQHQSFDIVPEGDVLPWLERLDVTISTPIAACDPNAEPDHVISD